MIFLCSFLMDCERAVPLCIRSRTSTPSVPLHQLAEGFSGQCRCTWTSSCVLIRNSYDIASMSGVLGTSAYTTFFDDPRSSIQGLITCSMPFGSIFGTILTSVIADRFSRKVAIQTACVLWILGSVYDHP